ncbi:hypothetical protein [Mesorhizobium sp.]|uniref:hypothetical protein n=1 Tax=Mesorhizobium sp. TaxID=1871066 RepID=UPI0025D10934|nr:hypothetical protein [Mesorhizobium sp.]
MGVAVARDSYPPNRELLERKSIAEGERCRTDDAEPAASQASRLVIRPQTAAASGTPSKQSHLCFL